MDILLYLAKPFLALCLTAALARAIYYQVVVMRRMAWPYGADETPPSTTARPPEGTSAARMKHFFSDPAHRPLRRTWLASWVWTGIFLFILIMWVVVAGNS